MSDESIWVIAAAAGVTLIGAVTRAGDTVILKGSDAVTEDLILAAMERGKILGLCPYYVLIDQVGQQQTPNGPAIVRNTMALSYGALLEPNKATRYLRADSIQFLSHMSAGDRASYVELVAQADEATAAQRAARSGISIVPAGHVPPFRGQTRQ